MDCSTPGFSVLYHLPELAQTHVHRVGDAIQPSHPRSSYMTRGPGAAQAPDVIPTHPRPTPTPGPGSGPCFSLLGSQISLLYLSSVQSLSCVRPFATPWTAALQASLSITNSRSLLKLMSTESVMPSNHLVLCYPLLLLPSIFPSIRVFSNESVLLIRWPKYWSFSSNEYSGLISFRIYWFGLLAVQGILKESSPTPQFKSINSLALSFLYGTALTSIHDY